MIKAQMIQRAEIEMTNKSKTNLGSTDLNQVIKILTSHIEQYPNFFEECITEERKNEIRKEVKEKAIIIAKEYINKIKEEQEHVERMKEEQKQIIKMYEESEKQRIQIEKEIKEERKKKEEIEKLIQKQKEENNKSELEKQRNYYEKELRKKEEECRRLQEKQREAERKREIEQRRMEEERRRRREEEEKRRDKVYTGCERYFQEQERKKLIEDLAIRARNGEFGNGPERKARLGDLYNEVQNKVNEMLGYPKKHY